MHCALMRPCSGRSWWFESHPDLMRPRTSVAASIPKDDLSKNGANHQTGRSAVDRS